MSTIDIDELRKSIRAEYADRIKVIEKEMEDELAYLDRLEERTRLLAGKPKASKTKSQTKPRKKASSAGTKKPAKERVLSTKQVLSGEFTRRDLHAAVNADGGEEMPSGTFSPAVTTLLREDVIVEVKSAVGSNPATYMWKEEFDKL